MTGHPETARKFRMSAEVTSLQFENFATAIAAEVVMMCLASHLISQSFTRHRDSRKPITLQQRANIAVYRRDA